MQFVPTSERGTFQLQSSPREENTRITSDRIFRTPSHAATILASNLSQLDEKFLLEHNIRPGDIFRVQIECAADVDAGIPASVQLLSNLIYNHDLDPDMSRVLYCSSETNLCVLGYDSVLYSLSIDDLMKEKSNGTVSPCVLAIGGEPFTTKEQSDLRGWIIPLIEVRFTKNEQITAGLTRLSLCCNLRASTAAITGISRAIHLLQHLHMSFQPNAQASLGIPPLVSQELDLTTMTENEYCTSVQAALNAFEDGSMSKVVLALQRSGETILPIDPAALLLAVVRSSPFDEALRYTFLFAPNGLHEKVFISLSPERLCLVEGNNLTTEALAGTFPRPLYEANPDIFDDKTRHEQAVVSSFIVEQLRQLVGEVKVTERKIHRMKDVVHLKSVLSLTTEGADALHGADLVSWVVSNLHPTPAVCGIPLQEAGVFIQTHEKNDRGLYASYCGVISQRGGELFVGIRSAVVHRKSVHVIAGAGLVKGSVASSEWAEINLKMSQYLRVLRSARRPAMQREFPTATAAMAAMVMEEMLRAGVGAFVVCPGSRSTPYAAAIYRNSVARSVTQVVHDERAAAFYAIGCARAGVLCAVLVTSGTAVSNLLPAVSEARESGLAIVLMTADRPSESRDIGEAQTIKQFGLFSGLVSYEKDFAAMSSSDPVLSANLMRSVLADISFGVSEVAKRRSRAVHFNFQIRHAEIDPIILDESFISVFEKSFHPKVQKWMTSLYPFTSHYSLSDFMKSCYPIVSKIKNWINGEWQIWSIIVVVGELRNVSDAMEMQWLATEMRLPCVCDVLSSMAADKDQVFLGADRLLNSPLFASTLGNNVRLVIRVGGPLISAKLQDWVSNLPASSVIRVRDDGHCESRHDPSWIVDHYVHAPVKDFCASLSSILPNSPRPGICEALKVLRLAFSAVSAETVPDLKFSEPRIAHILNAELPSHNPVYLSSSMACRDFDANSNFKVPGGIGRVGCNRGANGIDGVLSTAAGFAFGSSSDSTPLVVLVGDVTLLYDITGVSIGAGVSPGHIDNISQLGGGRVGKIVCINNSGGAIFSFLPSSAHRKDDFFSPYLDTPHSLNLASIATAMSGNSPTALCKRVVNEEEFREALTDTNVFFIECVCLPSHTENVAEHKSISGNIASAIESVLISDTIRSLAWTYHKSRESSVVSPLIVMLHGWMGSQSDWFPLIHQMGSSAVDILTVDSGASMHPTLFARALYDILHTDRFVGRSLCFVGYSQGGRLAMHYRSLYPAQVMEIITLSSAPHKATSQATDEMILDLARSCHYEIPRFLSKWYSLPVFSDMTSRLPLDTADLIAKRVDSSLNLHQALANMLDNGATKDAQVDIAVVGQLDVKYVALASEGISKGTVKAISIIPGCGHSILTESNPDVIAPLILSALPSIVKIENKKSTENCLTIDSVDLLEMQVKLTPPLEILTNSIVQVFEYRRWLRIIISVTDAHGIAYTGIGEVVEPVFSCRFTYEELKDQTHNVVKGLQGKSLSLASTSKAVAEACKNVLSDFVLYSTVVRFGFQQCLLHAFSKCSKVSIVDSIGAYIKQSVSTSAVRLNGFASARTCSFGVDQRVNKILKMKVGNSDGENAKADAHAVNDIVSKRKGCSKWLRLDANQSWSVDQAIVFAKELTDDSLSAIDYIEEPLRMITSISDDKTLYSDLLECEGVWRGIQLALDETLSEESHRIDAVVDCIKKITGKEPRWVVKPSILSLDADYLNGDDANVTISCTFESGITLAFLACIAAYFGKSSHGIFSRSDMAAIDASTNDFSSINEMIDNEITVLNVKLAEKLLNKYSDINLC